MKDSSFVHKVKAGLIFSFRLKSRPFLVMFYFDIDVVNNIKI